MPIELDHESYMDKLFEWSQDYEDKDGTWSWEEDRDWGDEVWQSLLEPFLKGCGVKKWSEIRAEKFSSKRKSRSKHIYYSIEKIKKEAADRLIDIELDDFPKIFRFRLDGKKRFYGL